MYKRYKRYEDYDKEKIINAYNSNMKTYEIQKKYSISRYLLYKIVNEYKIEGYKRNRKNLTIKEIKDLEENYNNDILIEDTEEIKKGGNDKNNINVLSIDDDNDFFNKMNDILNNTEKYV